MVIHWTFVLAAVALRLAIAFGTRNVTQDMEDWFSMRRAFLGHGFEAYSAFPRYPYLPGLIPWVIGAVRLGDEIGLPRDVSLKIPFILADACLVLLVFAVLDRRQASRRFSLLAASLVAFGPTFVVSSAYHGQFDALAILPAALAILLWDRATVPLRSVACGLLVGLGAATKTVPGFLVLALAPSARTWREAAALSVAAVAVPLVAMLPFVVSDPSSLRIMLGYAGYPGLGGWSVVVQPELARVWLLGETAAHTSATLLLYAHAPKVALAALALVGLLLLRRRTPPLEAACAVWLTVYAFAANFFAGYASWGLPFFLMAGRLGEAALLTALLLPITVISYVLRPDIPPAVATLYQVLAIVLQLTFVVLWMRTIATVWTGARTPAPPRPSDFRM